MNFTTTVMPQNYSLTTLLKEVSSTTNQELQTATSTNTHSKESPFFYNAAFQKDPPTLSTSNEALTVVLSSVIPLFVIGILGFAIYYYFYIYKKKKMLLNNKEENIKQSNSPQFGSTFKFIIKDYSNCSRQGKTKVRRENPFDDINALN